MKRAWESLIDPGAITSRPLLVGPRQGLHQSGQNSAVGQSAVGQCAAWMGGGRQFGQSGRSRAEVPGGDRDRRADEGVVPTVSPLLALAGGMPVLEVVSVGTSAGQDGMSREPQRVGGDRGGGNCQGEQSTSTPEPESVPAHVQVVCGILQGTFVTATSRVVIKENGHLTREITPNEMERLGGRAQTKKWKQSIKLLNTDGTLGGSIGDWLRDQGLDVRVPHSTSAFPIKRQRTALHPVNHQDAQHPRGFDIAAAKARMEAHLAGLHLGYRPGSPVEALVPQQLLPLATSAPQLRTVDLQEMSYQQLLVLARANGNGGVASTLLPTPPGIQPGREAFVSGQECPKRPGRQGQIAEGLALLGEYLSGERSEPPWGALGADKPPTVADQEVDLRRLYALVKEAGGCDEVSGRRGWQSIAQKIGLGDGTATGAGPSLRTFYHRFLLRAERQEEALSQYRAAPNGGCALVDSTSPETDDENGKQGGSENQVLEVAKVEGAKANGGVRSVGSRILQYA
ncbi:unnamed protein product [Ostreobium quekettii]|uniref:ARID domain-containing protein n=1 Tax=Ostreobium quekettii TaxID=121088 RepID=A0A8S1IP23_9CHLO|nr:unnamed protein product [Ostreobium quekettii]|eukprot:evm.model.scf_57.4 EVM.evm.TU.scf_57.4   scf_57:34071-38677(-)